MFQMLAPRQALGISSSRPHRDPVRASACRIVRRTGAGRCPLVVRASASAAAVATPPQEPSRSFLPFDFPTFLGALSSAGALLMHLGYLPQIPAAYFIYFLGTSVFSFLWGTFSTQATLNHDRAQYQKAAASAEAKYSELVASLKKQIERNNKEANELLTNTQKELKVTQESYQAQLAEVKKQLQAALQQAEENKQSAAEQLAAVEARSSSASASVSKLSTELEAAQVKIQALQADLSAGQAKLSELQKGDKASAELSSQLQDLQAQLQQSTAALEFAKNDKATADAVAEQLQRSLNAATEQVSLLQSQLKEEAAKAAAAAEAQAAAVASTTELQNSLNSTAEELATLKTQAQSSQQAAASFQVKLEEIKAGKDAELASVKKQLTELQAASKDVTGVATRASSLEAKLKELTKQRQNDQQELLVLRRFADETAAESRTLKKQNMNKNDEILELRRQLVLVNPGRLFDNFKGFGVQTFWSTIVEEYLLKPLERGGKLSHAAIVGADTGVWGADANFPSVTRQEVQDISNAITNNSTAALSTKGIFIGRKKYDFSSMKNGTLHGRTWGGGCCIVATANALVVGIWSDPLSVKPDDVEAQLGTVRDYLTSVGC